MKFGRSNEFSDDAAPLPGRERRLASQFDLPAKIGRRRKRGPRSLMANLRRQTKLKCAPPGMASGTADVDIPGTLTEMPSGNSEIDLFNQQPSIYNIFSINIRSVIKNGSELVHVLE